MEDNKGYRHPHRLLGCGVFSVEYPELVGLWGVFGFRVASASHAIIISSVARGLGFWLWLIVAQLMHIKQPVGGVRILVVFVCKVEWFFVIYEEVKGSRICVIAYQLFDFHRMGWARAIVSQHELDSVDIERSDVLSIIC